MSGIVSLLITLGYFSSLIANAESTLEQSMNVQAFRAQGAVTKIMESLNPAQASCFQNEVSQAREEAIAVEVLGPGFFSLNATERGLAISDPLQALEVARIGDLALKISGGIGRSVNGIGDAIRHALWSGLMVHSIGYEAAKKWGDAHEDFAGNDPVSKEMDLQNNEVGLQIGTYVKQNGLKISRILFDVVRAANRGSLKVIEKQKIVSKPSFLNLDEAAWERYFKER